LAGSVMGRSVRPVNSIRTFAQHAESAYSVAEGAAPAPDIEPLSTSWRRSATSVDPADGHAPRIVTSGELNEFREPLGKLIFSAQEEIDRLYKVVREAGYTILFCDTAGVAVEHRGEDVEASGFAYWGTWLGGVWSEEIEGTNGIGTCIAEERPVTVHRSQHFRSRHIDLSCSGAPIFGVDGRLMAVLDVSAIDPLRSESAHALTGALTINSARAIEERFFREHFHREWIVAIAPRADGGAGMLLAVDGNQRIVGANQLARTSLLLDDRGLQAGVSLWTIFEPDLDLFRRRDRTDIGTRLVIAGSNDSRSALVTPPVQTFARNATNVALHTRPRLDVIDSLGKIASAPHAQGGLSPGAMRRIREYVEAHLGDSMDLATLAAVAGLSIHHFARGFKQSTGLTPHHYLTQKRVERAQDMLAHTALSLSEIAYAVGFSDQSHLARHFRQMLGTTPGQFRWSQS
jgi:transcriptional regulator of acetoin/glycerol metabolism/AraC-like DNA-binding protein